MSEQVIGEKIGEQLGEQVVDVSDDSFRAEVLDSNLPVLVDYWAEWCGPCKMVAPLLQEIASEYQGRLRVCKVDVDSNPSTPEKYGVRGIPTLMLFKDGAVSDFKVGALTKPQLIAFLDENL